MLKEKYKIGVIGLGYVGLPLAVEFAKQDYSVVGFDINPNRVKDLENNLDKTLEVETDDLKEVSDKLKYTCESDELTVCNFFIVTVPTPIDQNNNPDLTPLYKASETVGKILNEGDIVVYESTVFPTCTEQHCVPILEAFSGLIYNRDFFCGYSPERINPGDKVHTLPKIKKVTSGSTPEIAKEIDSVYASIITAGTHLAASIKVAEAAKVIENAQRDINIAFVNELQLIFDKLDINIYDVIEAASTKWNFLPFKPGLVGGHCIGVDPYYLTYKAQELGYHPEVILSGRRINDNMGVHFAGKFIKELLKNKISPIDSKVLLMGITFKENCPDVRNTKAIDVYRELIDYGLEVDLYDPWADPKIVEEEYGIELKENISLEDYSGIFVAVAHKEFKEFNWKEITKSKVVYDIKNIVE